MPTNRSFFSFKLLVAATCMLCLSVGNARGQTAVTDSGIAVSQLRSSGQISVSYDKILAHPAMFYDGGNRVVEFSISFLPKGKDYYGPFITTGNKFPDKAISALRKFKADGVPVTRMFIEGIGIKERDSVRHLNITNVITLTP